MYHLERFCNFESKHNVSLKNVNAVNIFVFVCSGSWRGRWNGHWVCPGWTNHTTPSKETGILNYFPKTTSKSYNHWNQNDNLNIINLKTWKIKRRECVIFLRLWFTANLSQIGFREGIWEKEVGVRCAATTGGRWAASVRTISWTGNHSWWCRSWCGR